MARASRLSDWPGSLLRDRYAQYGHLNLGEVHSLVILTVSALSMHLRLSDVAHLRLLKLLDLPSRPRRSG